MTINTADNSHNHVSASHRLAPTSKTRYALFVASGKQCTKPYCSCILVTVNNTFNHFSRDRLQGFRTGSHHCRYVGTVRGRISATHSEDHPHGYHAAIRKQHCHGEQRASEVLPKVPQSICGPRFSAVD